MPNNINLLNNLFLKKKIKNLNIKSLNFYKLTKVLFLRNKYNYYFLIRYKLKKFVMFYNKLYFNYSSKLLYSNNLKKLFYFNLFTKKIRFGFNKKFRSIFFFRHKITTFSNFKFFKSLKNLNKIKRIRLNIMLKKNIQNKRKYLFRNFLKFFNKKKLFCNRLSINHKLFFNPQLRRSLKVKFLRTKFSQKHSQALKKKLFGNINKRPSSGTKIFFLLNLDKFLALKSSNSFFRLKHNISVFNLNRYFSLYNLKQFNGKKKINLKKSKSVYDKLKSKST